MRGRLTKRTVDALLPPSSGEIVLWDDTLAGFGVRVRPAGVKTYLVLYRAGVGRGAPLRKLTIGKHGSPWTPETARTDAKRLLGLVAGGADPGSVKAERRMAQDIADLAKRFLSDHAEPKRKARTVAEYRRLLDKIILPAFGSKKIVDVSRADIARLHHACRAAPYQANRVLALLSKMMNLAEAWGLRPDGTNPCRHVEKNVERGRERLLNITEMGRLGDALLAYEGSPYVIGAIKLLLFTGARVGEVLGLRWDLVDLERGDVRLPDSKTGAKTVHLAPPAVALLLQLPRVAGNSFIIVGQKQGSALVNLEKPWRAIRAAAGLSDVRLHDLRHAFASVGAARGDSLLIIGKLLGHSQTATTARYAHLSNDPIKLAAAGIAGHISDALGSGKAGTAAALRKSSP